MSDPTRNPLLQSWQTAHGLPPFERIRAEHFVPGFARALRTHLAEIEAIAGQTEAPTFANTLVAFDRSGRELVRIERLFFNLAASETSAALQAVEREMSPRLAAHYSAVYLHAQLFERIDALHRRRGELALDPEQLRLLERVHLDFVREGARLSGAARARHAAIAERLAELETRFSQNVLADEANYRLVLRTEDDLAGLPEGLRIAAREAAQERGEPTLLSADDVRTLFHEFGHGLHGLLSQVTYERLSGTQVLRDFVELPSQIFEHWAFEPAVLSRHARHCASGEPLAVEVLRRMKEARRFNQGFETVEYTACALVDMALHALPNADGVDITEFERAELERIGMPREIVLRHRLPHFGHLFASSAYAAGYYVYMWAEVLDADGYEAFAEAGNPFEPAIAERLRRYVYASGGTLDPAEAFRLFRGRDPRVEPMLAQRGLIDDRQPA